MLLHQAGSRRALYCLGHGFFMLIIPTLRPLWSDLVTTVSSLDPQQSIKAMPSAEMPGVTTVFKPMSSPATGSMGLISVGSPISRGYGIGYGFHENGIVAADHGFVGLSTCMLSKYWDPYFRESNTTSSVFCASYPYGRLDEGINVGRCLRAIAAVSEAGSLIESAWISGLFSVRTVLRVPAPSVGKVKGVEADRWVDFNVGDKVPTGTSGSDGVVSDMSDPE